VAVRIRACSPALPLFTGRGTGEQARFSLAGTTSDVPGRQCLFGAPGRQGGRSYGIIRNILDAGCTQELFAYTGLRHLLFTSIHQRGVRYLPA